MCGIAGVLRLGDTPITKEQIISMLLGIEERGGDATGIAMMTDGKLSFHKNDDIAWKYVAQKGFKDYLAENLTENTQSVILHTRAWTVGSPRIYVNNHPLTVGKSAIVHNGGISNHEFLFNDMKLERKAETDSDIIRAIIDKEGMSKKAIRSLNRMSGSCAAAILHKDHPKKVMLLRSGSPLVLAHTGDQIMWASTKKTLHVAARQWQKLHGMWYMANKTELKFNPMAEESAWILDVDEMLEHGHDPEWEGPWHDSFKSCSHYTAPNYKTYDRFQSKQEAKEKEAASEKEEDSRKTDETRSAAGRIAARPIVPAPAVSPHSQLPRQEAPNVSANKEEAIDMKVKCGNPLCGILATIKPEMQSIPLDMLQCPKCQTAFKTN